MMPSYEHIAAYLRARLFAAASLPGSAKPSPVADATGDHLPPGGERVVTTAAPGDGNPANKEHR